MGENAYDSFLEEMFIKILLIPYQSDKSLNMKMDDPIVIKKMSEWLDDDPLVAKRFLNELIVYLKSGLSYKHFISAAMYV